MGECIFCTLPKDLELRKVADKEYWYAAVPKQIGSYGQVLLVVKKLRNDGNHLADIADIRFCENEERLKSVMEGINRISNKLKLLTNEKRRVEKVYVLTQCENIRHLHFHIYPRYEDDRLGNEFLYRCELEEARWEDPCEEGSISVSERIRRGKRMIDRYGAMLKQGTFTHSQEYSRDYLRKVKDDLERLLTTV